MWKLVAPHQITPHLKPEDFWDVMPCSTLQQVHAGYFLGLFLDPKNGGVMFLQNFG
jgi:hypothetical protein